MRVHALHAPLRESTLGKIAVMSEADDWSVDGRNILTPDRLEAIRRVLEDVGPVIIEHGHYRRARSRTRLIFEDYEKFTEYLATRAGPGDAFWVWDFFACCRDDNSLANGKYPDAGGRVPKGGAY